MNFNLIKLINKLIFDFRLKFLNYIKIIIVLIKEKESIFSSSRYLLDYRYIHLLYLLVIYEKNARTFQLIRP